MIKKNANAWMTNKLFFDYIQEVVIPYVNNKRLNSEFKGKKGLIIVDNFSGHKLDEKQSQALDKAE